MTQSRPADFEGVLNLIPADPGGRQTPAHSGYRPSHQLHDNYSSTGLHEYLDGDNVQPGESGRVAVWLATPDIYPACLWEGREIKIHEGERNVGNIRVTKIHNTALCVTEAEYQAVWQVPRLVEIGDCLLNIFVDHDYQINEKALKRLGELEASPFILRMHAELFKNVTTSPGFATARFVANFLTGYRLNYTRTLAALNASSKNEKFFGLFQGKSRRKALNEYNKVCIDLGNIMFALPGYGHLAQLEVMKLIDANDSSLNSFGAAMLAAFPKLDEHHLEHLLAAMEKHGVREWPYQPGIALATALKQNPAWFETIATRFSTGNDHLQSAILETFNTLDTALPLAAQTLILQAAQARSSNHSDEVFSYTVIALSQCQEFRAQAIAILVPCLDSNAWFIRGNAAMSLGSLGVDDNAVVDRLGDMIFDTEGHDWSVQSAALQAMTGLGRKVRSQVPKLLRLAQTCEQEEDFNGYLCTNKLLTDCFAAAGDDSPAVIEALRKMVLKQGHISSGPAIIALGKFGKASLPAMDAINVFIFRDESHIDDAEKAQAVIEACIAINGEDHADVKNCLTHLAQSHQEDVADAARQYLMVQ